MITADYMGDKGGYNHRGNYDTVICEKSLMQICCIVN